MNSNFYFPGGLVLDGNKGQGSHAST